MSRHHRQRRDAAQSVEGFVAMGATVRLHRRIPYTAWIFDRGLAVATISDPVAKRIGLRQMPMRTINALATSRPLPKDGAAAVSGPARLKQQGTPMLWHRSIGDRTGRPICKCCET
jgi:hypothetical protein